MYGPWYLGVAWTETSTNVMHRLIQAFAPAESGSFSGRNFLVPRIMMPQQEDHQWTVGGVIHWSLPSLLYSRYLMFVYMSVWQ